MTEAAIGSGKLIITSESDPNLTSHYHNIGKSTAFDVRTFGCLVMIAKKDRFSNSAEFNAFLDHMYNSAITQKGQTLDAAPTVDFYGGVSLSDETCRRPFFGAPRKWTDNDMKRFTDGSLYLIALTGVTYNGSDGAHETQVCSIFFTGAKSAGAIIGDFPQLCPTHNTIK